MTMKERLLSMEKFIEVMMSRKIIRDIYRKLLQRNGKLKVEVNKLELLEKQIDNQQRKVFSLINDK